MAEIITAVFGVFTEVAQWLMTSIPTVFALFYTPATGSDPGQLTLLGVLALAGLGINVFLLLLGLVSKWFKFGA